MATVTVASKLPMDLVLEHEGRKALIHGSNHRIAENTPNNDRFGYTPGIDADWFASYTVWAMENKIPFILNGSVFANTAGKVRDEAREKIGSVTTGLEGINPETYGTASAPIKPTDETKRLLAENEGK